jgi:tetratricopeptide (TPR) repeat protein
MVLGHFTRTCALLATALFLFACQDDADRLAEHRKRADAYLEEGKTAEAIIEFKNMLQVDPNLADAHHGLAKAFIAEKKIREAYWELQETVRLDPGNLDAKLEYGQFLLYGKESEIENALTQAEEVLAVEPERVSAWVLKARALQALQRDDEAGEAFTRAVEVAPEEGAPLLLLANYHRRRDEPAQAEPLYRRLIEVEPGFASHAALAAFLAAEGGRDAEAEATYRKAIELAEEERRATAYSLLANFFYSRERFEEAEAVLREGVEAEGDNLELIYGLARFYHARGETAKADTMIAEATQADPENPQPYLLLSSYRGRQGDLEGALEAAEAALAVSPPDDLRAKLRKAELLVDLGYRADDSSRVAQGRAIVDAVLAREEANPEALFVKAKIDLAERELDAAAASLRRAIEARPEWAQAHFLLGSTLLLQGDRTGARAEVSRALELDAEMLDAQRILARIHASLGDHALAVETGRRVLRRNPDDVATHILVAQSLLRQDKVDEALAELEAIPEEDRDAEAHYALGRLFSTKREWGEARRHLMAAYDPEEPRFEVLQALLDLDVREGRLEESAKRIGAAQQAAPEDAQLSRLWGEVLLYSGRKTEAEAAFRRSIELDPNDLSGYQNLARYLAITGRPGEVLATYEAALKRNPESAPLNMVVGSLYELQSRNQEAMARYEEAIRLDPGLAVAMNNLAYLLSEEGGDLDRALELAQEAKALLPDNANAADTLGWVLYKKNLPSAAIGYLKEAASGFPADDPHLALVRHHLALAYEANGEPEKAQETLELAIRDLDAIYQAEDAERRSEPAWAADIRAMQKRLSAEG